MSNLPDAAGAKQRVDTLPLALRRTLGGNLRKDLPSQVVTHVPMPWWANPAAFIGGFIIPVYTLVYLVPALFGVGSMQNRSPIFFEQRYFWLGLAFLFCALLGSIAGTRIQPKLPSAGHKHEEYISLLYLEILALATIGAYMLWFRGIFTSPKALISLLRGDGEYGNVRALNPTIGGITTLAQCGIAYIAFYLDRVWGQRQPIVQIRFKLYFVAILCLSLFRAYAWAERLALIEVVVPIGLLYFCYRDRGVNPIMRTIRVGGPVIGVVGLILFFGVMEYFRSWNAYYVDLESSFWGFVMRRFLSYYYGALNNGSGLLLTTQWPTYDMQHVLGWLYLFPGMVGPIFQYAFDVQHQDLYFLNRYADPEFNNMSGIFTVYYDMGVPTALVYAGAWGCLAGAAFGSVQARRGILRLLYPVLFFSILEVMRLIYLGESRAFPVVLAIVVGYTLFRARTSVPVQSHQIRRARRHSTVNGGRWFRPRFGRFFGR